MGAERAGATFLLTDLDLANTFLDLAQTTCSAENRIRNIANARRAHSEITRYLTRLVADSEYGRIVEELRLLSVRLIQAESLPES